MKTLSASAWMDLARSLSEEEFVGRGGFEVRWIAKSEDSPYSDRFSVGRARNCDIVLRYASISKLHAHFRSLPAGGLAFEAALGLARSWRE